MSKIFFVLIFISFVATHVAASENTSILDNQEITKLVSGKKVFLKIPFGGEFPIKYDADGKVFGDGTGTGLGRFLAPKDEGKWWVENNWLCQKWSKWYDNKTTCFILSEVKGKKFSWTRDDGRKGKARIE